MVSPEQNRVTQIVNVVTGELYLTTGHVLFLSHENNNLQSPVILYFKFSRQ